MKQSLLYLFIKNMVLSFLIWSPTSAVFIHCQDYYCTNSDVFIQILLFLFIYERNFIIETLKKLLELCFFNV